VAITLVFSGSAAQNLAHVASGRLDCYYEDGYGGPWDVAAGKIIVEVRLLAASRRT
jgi:fructose-1,6-bisphosphatase/inositol monophosphatase family enzyme